MNFLSYPLNVCFYSSLFVEVLPAASTPAGADKRNADDGAALDLGALCDILTLCVAGITVAHNEHLHIGKAAK